MLRNGIILGFLAFAVVAAATGHLLLVGYALAILTLAVIAGLMAWGLVGAFSWRLTLRRRLAGPTAATTREDDEETRRAA